jgi:fermentation-respiration switch protein FrsA (DUF1100 family)
MRTRFDNERKLAGIRQPVFLVHGTPDRLVPYAHALRLKAVPLGPVELMTHVGAGHNHPLPPDFESQFVKFLMQ